MNRAQRRHPPQPGKHHRADARSLPRLMARLEPFTPA